MKTLSNCVSLPVWLLRRLPQATHLRACVVTKHQKRISGPLLDRIDIHIEVPRVDYEKLSGNKMSESSESIRARVQAARNIQQAQFTNPNSRRSKTESSNIISNADMRIGEIRQFCRLQNEGGALTVRLSLTVSKCQSLMRAVTPCCACVNCSYPRVPIIVS
jgi:predicted ATPase with chaperone activity